MPRRNNTPKHRPFISSSNCLQKRAFTSENEAMKAAELQMLGTPSLELAAYHCPYCGKWHLTSKPRTQ